MSFTSSYTNEKFLNFYLNGSSKKRTYASKKRIRKNFWKRKGYWTALKVFSLGKSFSTDNSKSFLSDKHTK